MCMKCLWKPEQGGEVTGCCEPAMCMLRTEPRTCARAARELNARAVSPTLSVSSWLCFVSPRTSVQGINTCDSAFDSPSSNCRDPGLTVRSLTIWSWVCTDYAMGT